MKALVLLLPFILCSCIIPVTQELNIGEDMSGRVIDSVSKKPIYDAEISYLRIPNESVRSNPLGEFDIEDKKIKKRYWMPPAPVCPPPWAFDSRQYTLRIFADGYEPQSFNRIKYRIHAATPEELGETVKDEAYRTFELKPTTEPIGIAQ